MKTIFFFLFTPMRVASTYKDHLFIIFKTVIDRETKRNVHGSSIMLNISSSTYVPQISTMLTFTIVSNYLPLRKNFHFFFFFFF
uniref:Uncharacterized protein n=1 Tax=Octopus bimaculoides TaxID=37653 RepID=A0A0L8HAX5_OCTBM